MLQNMILVAGKINNNGNEGQELKKPLTKESMPVKDRELLIEDFDARL